ncbi:hypothetical protein GCM10023204_41520 [Actinomycetospora succinea]
MCDDPHDLQKRRDICRAEFMLSLASGLAREASVEALRYRAAAAGVSLHAAALAVLSTEPTEQLLMDPPPTPEQPTLHGHLHAIHPNAATTTTSDALPGRHRRH